MIDPRALQQHFKKVHQKEIPQKPDVPRIENTAPLTAFKAIDIPSDDNIHEKIQTKIAIEEVIPVYQQNFTKEKVDLIIDALPPIDKILINEIELEEAKDKNVTKVGDEPYEETYDPYGYYSGPKF